MASSAKRPSGQWRARYRDEVGRKHARHFPRRVDARPWLGEVTASVVTGQYVDPRAGRVSVADCAAGWESYHVGRDGTARIIDNALRLHILPKIGTQPMHAVRRSDVQALVKDLSRTYAPGTVRNVYDVLSRVFRSAVDDRVVAVSPCRRVVLPRTHAAEVDPPTMAEVVALADAVPVRYRGAVVLLAGAGLRIRRATRPAGGRRRLPTADGPGGAAADAGRDY